MANATEKSGSFVPSCTSVNCLHISVTVVGANKKAEPAYMFGLDYLMLKPVE